MPRSIQFSMGDEITVRRMIETICRLMDAPVHIQTLNNPHGMIAHQVLDSSRARHELGWLPAYTLEDGLQETIECIGSGSHERPVHGRIVGAEEEANLAEVAKSQWYTSGKWCNLFEKRLREYLGVRHVVLCNSGSSANLLAVSALELSPAMK